MSYKFHPKAIKSQPKTVRSVREKSVEDHLYEQVEAAGGFTLKLNPNWNKGIPDRLVCLPQRVAFIETKRPVGGKVTRLQKWWHRTIAKLGIEVHVINTKSRVDAFLEGKL